MTEKMPIASSQPPEIESPPVLSPEPQALPGRFAKLVGSLFLGPRGLRALWRLVIFLSIFIGLIAGLSLLAHSTKRASPPQSSLEPRSLLNNEVVAFLVVLFASWVMSRIEHRKIADYGLPFRRALCSQFWLGLVFGFGFISALMLSMRLAGVYRFGVISLHGLEIWKYGAMWAAAFLFVGFFEEFFFRGYPLFTLTTGMTFWPSAILLSAFFGFIHHSNPGESPVGALEAGATGLLYCFILRRTGNLWMPIGIHAAWDWGETYFYGVPNSGLIAKGHLFNPTFAGPAWLTGGSVGPEGSWLCIALLAILWIIFPLWLREKKYPNPDATRLPRGPLRLE